MKPAPVGILLAAGQGTRFGSNKLLYPLADGTSMAVASARTLHTVLAHCIAVVNDAQGSVARLLAEAGLQVIANPHAPNGMGTSIACGVAASPNAGGWVIALADMPNIPARVIQSVADGLTCGADIIAAHRDTLELIDTQDSTVILDIDTPASLPVHPPGH